jgi:hypothetical protein
MSPEIRHCPKCDSDLPPARFDRAPNGRWSSYCKSCLSLYCRNHYVANAKLHNARRAAARHRYCVRNRAFTLEYLSTHPCVDCGEGDPMLLEFDHVDLKNKRAEVSTLSSEGRGLARIEREISLRVVRCAHCHRRRTARQFGWVKGISLFRDVAQFGRAPALGAGGSAGSNPVIPTTFAPVV